MRDFIFIFDQEYVISLGLKLSDLLFLDYMYKFMSSGKMRKRFYDDKWYYNITYNKILSDLPILGIKERQLRNMIISLEEKGILKRLNGKKTQLYIYIDFDRLFGENLPNLENVHDNNLENCGNILSNQDGNNVPNLTQKVAGNILPKKQDKLVSKSEMGGNALPQEKKSPETNCNEVGRVLPTIESINKKLIKIGIKNACAIKEYASLFDGCLELELKKVFSSVTFDTFLKDTKLYSIEGDEVVLEVSNAEIFKDSILDTFTQAVQVAADNLEI